MIRAHNDDILAELGRWTGRQIKESAVNGEIAIDRKAPALPLRLVIVARPEIDNCRSGRAKSSSASATIWTDNGVSARSSVTLPVARRAPLAPWNSTF